eukprot:469482-Rhodomonas_salina.1
MSVPPFLGIPTVLTYPGIRDPRVLQYPGVLKDYICTAYLFPASPLPIVSAKSKLFVREDVTATQGDFC